jgi:hypothetical protein
LDLFSRYRGTYQLSFANKVDTYGRFFIGKRSFPSVECIPDVHRERTLKWNIVDWRAKQEAAISSTYLQSRYTRIILGEFLLKRNLFA